MGLAVVAMIVFLIAILIAIPILMRVFGEAAGRNENRGGEGSEGEEDRRRQSGPGRE